MDAKTLFTRPTTEIAKSMSHTNEMQEKSGEAVLAFGSSKRKEGRKAGRLRATRRREGGGGGGAG